MIRPPAPPAGEQQGAAAAAALKDAGNAHFQAKRFEEALECYTRALALAPHNHLLWSNSSMARAALNQWFESEADAARAVQLVPGFVKGYYRVAKAQLEQGKCEQAIASAAAGLALDPTDRSGSVKDFQKLQAAAEAQLQQQLAQAQRDSNSDDAAAAALDEHDGLESHEPDAIDSSGVGSEDRRFSIKEFKTVNELGTGNFSTILTVEHKRTGKRYALKVIDKSEASRIKRRHPNVYNEIYMEKRALTK
eukprot:17240-Heterococcus_DN1.PRE.1